LIADEAHCLHGLTERYHRGLLEARLHLSIGNIAEGKRTPLAVADILCSRHGSIESDRDGPLVGA
jgi:hypothetical protein